MEIKKQDLLKDIELFNTDILNESHESFESGNANELNSLANGLIRGYEVSKCLGNKNLDCKKWDNIHWIIPPIVGIYYTRDGESYSVGVVVFNSKVCETTLNKESTEQSLYFDVFMAKGKVALEYNFTKGSIDFDATFCYRKVPSLEWRCFDTGKVFLCKI